MELRGRPLRGGRAEGIVRLGPAHGDAVRRSILALRTLSEFPVPGDVVSPAALVSERSGNRRRGWACPVVSGIPIDSLRPGDRVRVDGDRGVLELPGVREVPVVTAFLQRPDRRILLLRRSRRVGSFQGRWSAVSGTLESGSVLSNAFREIQEETGIGPEDLRLASRGHVVRVRDGPRLYSVHPLRFLTRAGRIRLNWENIRSAWVGPSGI
ncbi:MAG TPA: NUDIX domain-containing protein, partial [Thermoplasmata archaeon]|nr:NUDIX domain-containing protein [Thermoplasmata archaeon]